MLLLRGPLPATKKTPKPLPLQAFRPVKVPAIIAGCCTPKKWKSLFTIKQNGSRIEHIKGKKTTKQDSENT